MNFTIRISKILRKYKEYRFSRKLDFSLLEKFLKKSEESFSPSVIKEVRFNVVSEILDYLINHMVYTVKMHPFFSVFLGVKF